MQNDQHNSTEQKDKHFGLSRHYNASQLRMDTWNRLKYATRRLEEKYKTRAEMSGWQNSVLEYFEILEPIESYWAFPGKDVMKQLEALFDRQEYRLLSNVITHVVRMLVSDSYRHKPTSALPGGIDRVKEKFDRQDVDDDDTWLNTRLLPDPDRVKIRVYATQSTHKKLSSLRQGSMIHIYDEEFNRKVEDTFHEAYMTHTSTSPNYQILASLDIARRQVELEGYELVQKSAEMAMMLRAKITDHPLLRRYFEVLATKDLIPPAHRSSGLEQYYDSKTGWSRMEEAWRNDEFVLDPTHITLYTGKTGIDGDSFKNRYLMDQFGIQINKTSRNTVLFMTNIGTTRSAVAFLISVLLNIARQFEQEETAHNPVEQEIHHAQIKSLTEDLPPLPDFSYFHPKFRPNPQTHEGDMRAAYFMAYNEELCEFLKLDGTIEAALEGGREVVSTSFVIPYPPGFPILVPGQVISQEILTFLKVLDVKEIHGYRPQLGLRVFTEAALAQPRPERATDAEKKGAKDETGPAEAVVEPVAVREDGSGKDKQK